MSSEHIRQTEYDLIEINSINISWQKTYLSTTMMNSSLCFFLCCLIVLCIGTRRRLTAVNHLYLFDYSAYQIYIDLVTNIIITHSERALFDLNARVEAQGGTIPSRDDTRAFKSNRARSLCVIIIILTDVTRIHMSHPNPKYII